MTTSDPTTGEIVRVLRGCAEKTFNCEECPYNTGSNIQCLDNIQREAADRLESQEREIAELTGKNDWSGHACDHMINKLRDELRAMTARAEQAEKWAAAAITDIERLRLKKFTLCPICEFEDMIGCAHKNHCTGYEQFKWRGLPQEGERKSNG